MSQQAELLLLTGATPPAPVGGFPMYLFTVDGAEVFDPSNPANLDATGGAALVYGGFVGEVKGESTAASDLMRQSVSYQRPIFRRVGDRDCFEFNGIDDSLWAPLTLSSAFATVPKTLTLFVSVYLHTDVSGQTGFSLEGSSANTNSRHLLTTSASGCRTGVRFGTTPVATNVIWEDAATLGTWMDLFWELDVQQMQVAGAGTGVGTIKSWMNEEAMRSTSIVPNRTATSSSATFNVLSLGSARSAGAASEWCACTIGKSGFARRALIDDERDLIKDWMRAPAYVPPMSRAA